MVSTTAPASVALQHLIDPATCIRCNTCEETCPIGAITHDTRNYVVNFDICNGCRACVPPCPTGAIDNWHRLRVEDAHAIADQLLWDELPAQAPIDDLAAGEDVPEEVAHMTALAGRDRKSTRLNSSHQIISYAVFCLKKKKD